MVPIINKSTCVTKKTVDHIFMNSVTTTKFKIEIASDHFPIFFVTDYDIYIKKERNRIDLSAIFLIFPWKNSNTNDALLTGKVL